MTRAASGFRAGVVACLLGAVGCASNGRLDLLRTPSPYEAYVETLQRAGLDTTALGRDWLRASARAAEQAARVALPFSETGYFAPETPAAAGYRMDLQRGRRLVVDVSFESSAPARLFVDLFELSADASEAPMLVASLEPEAPTLTHDVTRDATYLLRIQPELLRGGRFTLVERTVSSLAFPVSGLTAGAVQSGFGAARDGGVRGHEGIDIFAPRGTPVTAVVDGVAQTDTNGLGGNVVWLRDGRQRRTYYYAHLDRWALEGTATVKAGDVLGYVGNTGNARTTAPHLHFGIYEGGPIDPLPFVQPDDPQPSAPAVSVERLGQRVRAVAARAPLRAGPAPDAPALAQIERATLARVVGVAARVMRVVLDDGSWGYVGASAVTPADTPLRRAQLTAGTVLRENPAADQPIVEVVAESVSADVLGRSGPYAYVRVPDGAAGWTQVGQQWGRGSHLHSPGFP